jgi:hypothetical protein
MCLICGVWDYDRCNVHLAWPATHNKIRCSIHPPLRLTSQYHATQPPVLPPCKRQLASQAAAVQIITAVSMPWDTAMAPTHVES